MRLLIRWMVPLCFVMAVGALLARPAAAAAGCRENLICASCVCNTQTNICECTLCFPECFLLLF